MLFRSVYQQWNPAVFSLPQSIPIDEPITIWGRDWIVQESSLGIDGCLGVFALEDIEMPETLARDEDGPHLFPYCGPIYSRRHWNILVAANPWWKKFQLDLDMEAGSLARPGQTRVVDGDPVRCANLSGYINSTYGTKPKKRPNVQWVHVEAPPSRDWCSDSSISDHVVTVLIRSIRAGEELFCDYLWDS